MKPQTSLTWIKGTPILISFMLIVVIVALIILEFVFVPAKPLEIPFHNVIYPYVEFRPPSLTTWTSDLPSPSSRTGELATTYTNQDALRVESLDYHLTKSKPPGQVRIAILGGSTVHIGTRFEVTLPGALKRVLHDRNPHGDIEVINAGIISAISRQELIFLITTLVNYDLDMLVTYDGINDTGQMLYYEKRPNFPYNYRVKEIAWDQYVAGKRDSIWKEVLSRSAAFNWLWPKEFGEAKILDKVNPRTLINDQGLRQIYAEAHVDNWEKIRRICVAYQIAPVFILQPTSLYDHFSEGLLAENILATSEEYLYANYLVYEEFRHTTQIFLNKHPEVTVSDMSSLLPEAAFYDGAHVYDEVNIQIAEKIADLLNSNLQRIIGEKPRKDRVLGKP
jgi:hypothetical protein